MDRNHTTYVAGGYCGQAKAPLELQGFIELILYNPTPEPCTTTMTVFFADREPHTFAPVTVSPDRNHLLVMPDFDRAVFENCGFWGACFASTTPLIADLIGGVSASHPDRSFQGGCVMALGDQLHTEWHFADGYWLEHNKNLKGDIARAPFPFNELEYYYFLNPGPEDAKVDMTLRFRRVEHMTFHLTVPAQRVLTWCNYEKIPYHQPYAVKVLSSQPIMTTSTRFIYGLTGTDEWGVTTHCAMPAKRGPYTEW